MDNHPKYTWSRIELSQKTGTECSENNACYLNLGSHQKNKV